MSVLDRNIPWAKRWQLLRFELMAPVVAGLMAVALRFMHNSVMRYISKENFRSFWCFVRDIWAAHPSGSELAMLLPFAGALMVMGLCAADVLDTKPFLIFLLVSTIVFATFFGAVDTSCTASTRPVLQILPGSALAISIMLLLTRLVGDIASWCAYVSVVLHEEATVIRSLFGHDTPTLPTPDLHPSGPAPRILYEPA